MCEISKKPRHRPSLTHQPTVSWDFTELSTKCKAKAAKLREIPLRQAGPPPVKRGLLKAKAGKKP